MIERQEDDFLPFLQARVNVNDIDGALFIREAVIAFMRDSKLFKGMVKIIGQECIEEYIIPIPAHHVITDIITQGVTKNGMDYCDWYRDDDEEVLIFPNAKDGDCFLVEYYYHITRDGCGIPEVIYNKYADVIIDKAITLMYEGKADGVVSTNLYRITEQAYRSAIELAAGRRMHKMGSGYGRMRLPHQSRKIRCR